MSGSCFYVVALFVQCLNEVVVCDLSGRLTGFERDTRFAPLLEKKATVEDPSRVIVTASVAGLGVDNLGDQVTTFGYAVSKAAVIVCLLFPPESP